MKTPECGREAEVLMAVRTQGERSVAPELRQHMAECEDCADLAKVAEAFEGARESLMAHYEMPNASRVWHQAQMRARREAVKAAGRPITAVQVLAFAAAMGLMGACFGATSSWFQAAVGGLLKAKWPAEVARLAAEHGVVVLGVAAVVVLLPTAVCVALGRE